METKVCCRCKKELSTEYFYKSASGKYGVKSTCIDCYKEYAKERNERLGYSKAYYQIKKDIISIHRHDSYVYKPDIFKTKSKIAYDKNKELAMLRIKNYRHSNREKKAAIKNARRLKEKGNGLTIGEWEYCKEAFNNKCAYCGKEKKLTQDHFTPLHSGGVHDVLNIVPACRNCNSSKGIKGLNEWYPKQKDYSLERELMIYSYLNDISISANV